MNRGLVVPDGASLWYEIVAKQSGTLVLSTFGSNYDTVLSVWDGSGADPCLNSAAELACNDDGNLPARQSRVLLGVTTGQRLIVRVAAFGRFEPDPGLPQVFFDNPDQLVFTASFVAPLVNDACVDAIDVTAPAQGEVVLTATTSDATVESDESASNCGFEEATVWYRVMASANGPLTISTDGSAYDTVLAVFDGSETCGAIQTELGCNDDHAGLLTSEVVLAATIGQEFLVRVSAFPLVFPTDLTLTVPEPSAAMQGLLAVGLVVGLRARQRRRSAASRSR